MADGGDPVTDWRAAISGTKRAPLLQTRPGAAPAIESFPEDINVAIVATGGLSHQVHGERCGFNNPDWDAQFVDMLVNDPEKLTEMTLGEYAELGGMEGSEVIMWLVMRGALSANVTETWRDYYLPSMTGIATLILENNARLPPSIP